MTDTWVSALLFISAVGCGLMGGLYFAFSAFIMTALSRIDAASGVAAMNSINVVILRSLFTPLFFGTTVAALVLAVLGLFRWGTPDAPAMLVGGVLYVLGMFVVTMMWNVPLNNALKAAGPSSADGAAVWAQYLREWTMWNHVRTVASRPHARRSLPRCEAEAVYSGRSDRSHGALPSRTAANSGANGSTSRHRASRA